MKKILSYILILIALILTVTPVITVRAYDTTTKGKCTIRAYPGGVEETDWLDYTEAQCHADTYPDKKNANAEFIKWTAYGADCVKPLSRSSVDGSCVCQLPWGVMKDGKCVNPASITCTNPPTNNQPVVGCTPPTTNPPATQSANYTFLAPLPCDPADNTLKGVVCDPKTKTLTSFDPTGDSKLGTYLNIMIKIFIGICAVLAVIMIVVGGIEYMTSELPESKGNGKNRIMGAIFGLILALGAWTLLYTINPDLLNSDFKSLTSVTVDVTLEDQIKSYTGQGKCEPITSGICSPASLASAGFTPEPPRATQASSICNGESRGNPTLASGVDKCSDGNSFSFGLFQINILAHANEIPGGVCSNIFKINRANGGGIQGDCLQRQGNICIKYDCSVQDTAKFRSCVDYITNSTNNIAYALRLQSARGWGQWGANASCKF